MIIGADPNPIRHENQPQSKCKSIALAAFISTLAVVIFIDMVPPKECVRWNLEQDSLEADYRHVLEVGTPLEDDRSKKLDAYGNSTAKFLGKIYRRIDPLSNEFTKLYTNHNETRKDFLDADKKHREARSRVEKARMKVDLHSANMPRFCNRSFKSHR